MKFSLVVSLRVYIFLFVGTVRRFLENYGDDIDLVVFVSPQEDVSYCMSSTSGEGEKDIKSSPLSLSFVCSLPPLEATFLSLSLHLSVAPATLFYTPSLVFLFLPHPTYTPSFSFPVGVPAVVEALLSKDC